MAAVSAPRQFIPLAQPREKSRARPSRPQAASQARLTGQQLPFRRALLLAGIPVLCLVLYVGMWTVAMRGGYYKNRLTTQIRALQIENDSLQAEVRRLQSPARILREASAMKMQRPTDIKFVELTPARHLAQR